VIVPIEGAVLFELRRAILLSPQCGDTTSCIRHLCIRQATFVNFKGKLPIVFGYFDKV
jgi:hypothetical protein